MRNMIKILIGQISSIKDLYLHFIINSQFHVIVDAIANNLHSTLKSA